MVELRSPKPVTRVQFLPPLLRKKIGWAIPSARICIYDDCLMIKIYNLLPDFEKFLDALETGADFKRALNKYYLKPNKKLLNPFFNDIRKWRKEPFDFVGNFNFKEAQRRMADLKNWGWPKRGEEILKKVEQFYGKKLSGNLVLCSGFGGDGYTRFDRGVNTIYLQLDFFEADQDYFDILLAHELNHLVRDSNEAVLRSYGASSKMAHDKYIDKMTFAEHTINEGLAGYFSSIIFPNKKPWQYLYYSKKQYDWCMKNHKAIEKIIKEYISAEGDWGIFYRENLVGDESPERLQYYFGLALIKKAAKKYPLQKLTFMPAAKIVKEFL